MVLAIEETARQLSQLQESIGRVIRGKSGVIRRVVAALLCRGHVLVEDVPGVGKTTLAQALARSLDLGFQRIQFTSDTLPSDILGISIFSELEGKFEFRPGPVFSNVVLADEINRTTPKTQSALLEAMNERGVTIDGSHRPLPEPFLVIATQNPSDSVGTYPLPESQLDRFLFRLKVGYPDAESEKELLRGTGGDELLSEVKPVLTAPEVFRIQKAVEQVRADEKILDYVVALGKRTRGGSPFRLGASPRAVRGLLRAARAEALLDGRDYVRPDDVKEMAVETLAHRIIVVTSGTDRNPEVDAIRQVLDEVAVPR